MKFQAHLLVPEGIQAQARKSSASCSPTRNMHKARTLDLLRTHEMSTFEKSSLYNIGMYHPQAQGQIRRDDH